MILELWFTPLTRTLVGISAARFSLSGACTNESAVLEGRLAAGGGVVPVALGLGVGAGLRLITTGLSCWVTSATGLLCNSAGRCWVPTCGVGVGDGVAVGVTLAGLRGGTTVVVLVVAVCVALGVGAGSTTGLVEALTVTEEVP